MIFVSSTLLPPPYDFCLSSPIFLHHHLTNLSISSPPQIKAATIKRYSPLSASFSRGERTPLLMSSSYSQQITPPPSAPPLSQYEEHGLWRDRGK
ncbi:hypothetical protein E2C01_077500 [Portunus trituberculatus]|uniref:Uncharacterized protein n=1 Tax=Portunus trituberculatus TaxID=210409 RepID=A0A5B7IKF3_PORTR|nr:hypothetical protein [Portunus trituberculatus]